MFSSKLLTLNMLSISSFLKRKKWLHFDVKISNCRFSSNSSDHLKRAATYIQQSKNILVMTGAGLSTSSGIPDFRTPGTGLYDNLEEFILPYPEAIFDISYFMKNPRPFYKLAQKIYPGVNFKPNIGHYFLSHICNLGQLQRIYTQNIDGLETLAGIPNDKLVESHGTFSTCSCTVCCKIHDHLKIKDAILNDGEPFVCGIQGCKGIVKPDIVFFTENLPDRFWEYKNDVKSTDLLVVMGTSLEVYPFASVADCVEDDVPRILLNRDAVGSIGERKRDLLVLGEIPETVSQLANILGWKQEIQRLMTS